MNKTIKLLPFFIISVTGLNGQIPPITDQYILNPLSINPAYAGEIGVLNIAAFYRQKWVGIEGAPKTATLAMDAPFLNSKIGLGLIAIDEKTGVTKDVRLNSNYAFKIRLGEGNMSFGLGAGLIATNTAWASLTTTDPGDEQYLINSRAFIVPEFSFGIYYSASEYFIGISLPKLLDYKFDLGKNRYIIDYYPGSYYYLINAGYLFSISPGVRLSPSTLIAISPSNKIWYDLNAHFILHDNIWLGASYRCNRSVNGLLMIAINKQVKVGYTFGFDLGRLSSYSSGSHEVMLRYEFHSKVNAINPISF